jgi:hypothetical protein
MRVIEDYARTGPAEGQFRWRLLPGTDDEHSTSTDGGN